MKFLPRAIAIAFLVAVMPQLACSDEIGPAIRDVPIFDAHIHYKEPAWGPYPVKTVIELMVPHPQELMMMRRMHRYLFHQHP